MSPATTKISPTQFAPWKVGIHRGCSTAEWSYLKFDVEPALNEGPPVGGHALILHELEAVWLDDFSWRAGDLDSTRIQMLDDEAEQQNIHIHNT